MGMGATVASTAGRHGAGAEFGHVGLPSSRFKSSSGEASCSRSRARRTSPSPGLATDQLSAAALALATSAGATRHHGRMRPYSINLRTKIPDLLGNTRS